MDKPDRPEGLRIGDCVEVRIGDTYNYYKVRNRDKIFYTNTHTAVASGATSSFSELTDLDPPRKQIYQFYHIHPDANVKIYLKQPASTNRWGTNKSPSGGYITDRDSSIGSGELLNIWTIEDYPPVISIENPTNVSITPKTKWIGWRYEVDEIRKPAIYTPVNVGGIGN